MAQSTRHGSSDHDSDSDRGSDRDRARETSGGSRLKLGVLGKRCKDVSNDYHRDLEMSDQSDAPILYAIRPFR